LNWPMAVVKPISSSCDGTAGPRVFTSRYCIGSGSDEICR
jgi:hypothetical protein